MRSPFNLSHAPMFYEDDSDASDRVVDELLNTFVHAAEQRGVRVGVTLVLPGGPVAGTLISSAEYATLLGTALASAAVRETAGQTLPVPDIAARMPLPEHDEDDEEPLYAFACLTDAQLVTGHGHVPGAGGLLMRVRLADVTAWAPAVVGA